MPKNHRIITALDIGTNQVKALAAVKNVANQALETLGAARISSFGIRRGVVAKPEEVSLKIVEALRQLQEEAAQKIEDVYVNIGGSHLFLAPSQGSVVVSRADQRISEEDRNRVLQAAQTFSLPSNKEILNIFPAEFIVDNQGQVKDPIDMQGVRLEVKILALCAFSPFLRNLTNAVLDAGFQIADIIPSALASARAVLTPQQKELGVCLLDIGAGTTDMAVYSEGDLIHLAVFPLGSELITNDLAIGLKTDLAIAEQIKQEFGTCVFKGSNKKEKVQLPEGSENGEFLMFDQKTLVKIIEARAVEIFELVKEELGKIPPKVTLPAGVVLTGGGAKLSGIVELAKRELKLPVRIGKFNSKLVSSSNIEEDPSWSTALGLLLEGKDSLDESGTSIAVLNNGIIKNIKKFFRVFIP